MPTPGARGAGAVQRREPFRLGLRVVVQQRDELPARRGNALIVGGAEAAIPGVANHPRAEFLFRHLGRPVRRPVVDHDGFEFAPACRASEVRQARKSCFRFQFTTTTEINRLC